MMIITRAFRRLHFYWKRLVSAVKRNRTTAIDKAKFYRDLKQRGICVRVGMEATGIHAGSSDC